jgi:hypothetical protein
MLCLFDFDARLYGFFSGFGHDVLKNGCTPRWCAAD